MAQVEVPELELISGSMSIMGVDPYSGSGEDDAQTRVIEVNAAVFVSAMGSCTLPQHKQSWTIEVDGHPPRSMQVRIDGPFQYARSAAPGEQLRLDVRVIQVLGDCGLAVHGSAEVKVTGRAYLSREEIEIWEAAPWIDLAAVLPLDRSSGAAALRARFEPNASLEVPGWDPITQSAVPEFKARV